MREQRKKWLFDKGKTSGSRKRWSYGGDFANERNTKAFKDIEDAPKKAGMKTGKVFNNRLSFRPLRRFLKTKVGKNWNEVYSEMKERIPQDIWDTHNPIEFYVYVKVEIQTDGSLFNKKAISKFHSIISPDGIKHWGRHSAYYVHPETNLLCRLEPSGVGKKKMDKKEGKKKFAQIKTEKNKSKRISQNGKAKFADELIAIMKEKKQNSKLND